MKFRNVKCEDCGVIMARCSPTKGRILCEDCARGWKPENNRSLCGNEHTIKHNENSRSNFFRDNEQDNWAKAIEEKRGE